jgi:hypothetical protein
MIPTLHPLSITPQTPRNAPHFGKLQFPNGEDGDTLVLVANQPVDRFTPSGESQYQSMTLRFPDQKMENGLTNLRILNPDKTARYSKS